jgi:putative ABC transport system permease protein
MGPDEQSASIIVPLSTLYQRLSSERLADGSLPIAVIMTQAHDAEAADKLVEEVRLALREEHELTDTQEDDFQIFAQNAFLESLSTITSLITAFLAVIAGISLIVGGIGIMNIMLVTVTERTREIGLRKAVGAQNSDILLQFITESIMLSAIGGLLGTLLAMGLSAMMSAGIPDLNIVIRPTSIALATTVSVMIGVFFGAFPANRAARMKPIDALRFE